MSTRAETQAAAAVMMVRPAAFESNPETLQSNHFQTPAAPDPTAATAARRELDGAAAALDDAGVAVHVFEGNAAGDLPDEVFPNNWVSFHGDGTMVLYPMLAPSRRRERRPDIIDALRAEGYETGRVVDLTGHEQHGRHLEGTGSMVLDRVDRIAYACRSPRTHPAPLAEFGDRLGYEIVAFDAFDHAGRAVYHTNVLMSLGTNFAAICLEAIPDRAQRSALSARLRQGDRELIELSLDQMHAFAGNLLELRGRGPVIGLSTRAWESLDQRQRARLGEHGRIVAVDVGTIERLGGGSLRCMLAEVHLPRSAAHRDRTLAD